MCFIIGLFVFLIAPLYHTQLWLVTIIENKGQESIWFRIPFIFFYLIAWIFGFGFGLIRAAQVPIVAALFMAFIAVFFVTVVFFTIAMFLPDRTRSGTLYRARVREPDEEELAEFREARRRAKRAEREHKERLRREQDETEQPGDDDLPVLRPRQPDDR